MNRVEGPKYVAPDEGARSVEIRAQEKPGVREARA